MKSCRDRASSLACWWTPGLHRSLYFLSIKLSFSWYTGSFTLWSGLSWPMIYLGFIEFYYNNNHSKAIESTASTEMWNKVYFLSSLLTFCISLYFLSAEILITSFYSCVSSSFFLSFSDSLPLYQLFIFPGQIIKANSCNLNLSQL